MLSLYGFRFRVIDWLYEFRSVHAEVRRISAQYQYCLNLVKVGSWKLAYCQLPHQ